MHNQTQENKLSSVTVITIGYAMPDQKISTVIQPSLIAHAKKRGINLVQVHTNKPLIEQGPFDCLLHKIYHNDWNTQLLDFKSKYPKLIIIDSPESISNIHNRISMLNVVNKLKIPAKNSVGIPNQMVLADANDLNKARTLTRAFPVIAKPLLANSSDNSHKMSLVFNSAGLEKVKPPVVVQEFVNHGGVLFKVYVAGEHVKCVKRRSLPDFDVFDGSRSGYESGHLWGDIMAFSQISSSGDVENDEFIREAEMPDMSFVQSVAKGLREGAKLNLFNFDMIRDARKKGDEIKYFIIDINYFPGYAKVPGFETMLTDFFWDVINHSDKINGVEDDAREKVVTTCQIEKLRVKQESQINISI